MAKRFTDTDKWKKPFIRGLQAPYKLLWFYILDDCDFAGMWQVDFDIAKIKIGSFEIKEDEALKIFSDKIVVLDGGEKWFIPDFIEFQYGQLNPQNRAHNSVLNLLNKYKNKGLISSLQGAKDKEQDKDKDKDKEGEKNIPSIQEFLEYCKTIKEIDFISLEFSLKSKYESWVSSGWKDGNKKPILNWKGKIKNVIPFLKPIQPIVKSSVPIYDVNHPM